MTSDALVIFDCDGVLVDSELISHQVLLEMLAEHGHHLTLQEAIDRFLGTSTAGFLRLLGDLMQAAPPPTFLSHFHDRSLAAFGERLTVVPGVVEVVESLGGACCVASNGPHAKINFTLGHTGLLPHFPGRVFSAEDVTHPKPAPDLFLHAARSLGVDPARCTVVEDSPTGVKAARAAGMRVLGYAAMTPARRLHDAGAHGVFTRMADLPALLGSALPAA